MTIRLWLDVNADAVQMLWCTHGVDDGRAAVAGPDVGETLIPRGAVVAAPAAAERVAGRHAVRTLVINLARLDRNLRHLQHVTTTRRLMKLHLVECCVKKRLVFQQEDHVLFCFYSIQCNCETI